MKIQDYASGRRVTLHLASGEVQTVTVTAADLIGVLATIGEDVTIIPWASLDRVVVSR